MSEIRALAAIRFAAPMDGDVSARLAPPYDVLDESEKRALLGRDACNFVAIDLPHVPPKTAGLPEAYEGARRSLDAWLSSGTLVRDAQPGLYVYHQQFTHAGRDFVRKMFFARLRLEAFGAGSVYPHERTFGGPKEDRLALTKATQTNLSPIFGLYPDADNVVSRELERSASGKPLLSGTLDGVVSRLWQVTDPAVISRVSGLMAPKPTYIADGHHRYGTSLLYRDFVAERSGGAIAPDHPANFVLCVFCALEDPGLLILPTHRVLPGLRLEPGAFRADPEIEIAHLTVSDAEGAPAALAPFGPQALALFSGGAWYMLRPRRAELLDAIEPAHSSAWRRLALAFLHAYLLERVVAPQAPGRKLPEIHYVKAARSAVEQARDGSAFVLQPTTMQELRDVCQAGDLMPQKSTFFFPKLASGLVVSDLRTAGA